MIRKSIRNYLDYLKVSGIDEVFIDRSIFEKALNQKETVVSGDPGELLAQIEAANRDCRKCVLCEGRNKFVYGGGNPRAKMMLIGEGPGGNEDRIGKPFVGAAGQLLDKMLAAINIHRDQIYIGNMVKCRPPNNRDPNPEEVAACRPLLDQQIDIIKPQIIVLLGRVAAQALLETGASLGSMRAGEHQYRGIRTFATYHPAALLRNPTLKKAAWIDLQRIRDIYNAL